MTSNNFCDEWGHNWLLIDVNVIESDVLAECSYECETCDAQRIIYKKRGQVEEDDE
jgi:hypothetical protein